MSKREVVHVYPSEVLAASMRRRATKLADRKIVRSASFLSWDRFKEKILIERTDRTPVNRHQKQFFTAELLNENAAAPFLKQLVPEEHAANSSAFRKLALQTISGLNVLVEHRSKMSGDGFSFLKHDVDQLLHRYNSFLDRNELFDPSFFQATAKDDGFEYRIWFPQCILDFEEFREVVFMHPGVKIGNAEDPAVQSNLVLTEYGDEKAEVRQVIGACKDLLGNRTPIGEIVISCGDLDMYRDELAAAAWESGVPLFFREGKAVTELPGGTLFRHLRECGQNGYRFEAVRNFLLDHAVPWQDRSLCRSTVRFATEYLCLGTFDGRDFWKDAIKRYTANPEAIRGTDFSSVPNFITRVRNQIDRICAAPSFDSLVARIHEFTAQFLMQENWDESAVYVYKMGFELLKDLNTAVKAVDLPVDNPFGHFIDAVENSPYVPQGIKNAVSVYPYRVAAGIRVEHHFVIGCSAKATEVKQEIPGFIREDQRERLGLKGKDFSQDFFELYSSARESGAVQFSFARESGGAVQLAPEWFFRRGVLEQGVHDLSGDLIERSIWRDRTSNKGLFLSHMKEQLKSGMVYQQLAGWGKKDGPITHVPISEPGTLEFVRWVHRGKDNEKELPSFSASHLNRYNECPFDYFCSRILEVREVSYQPDIEEPAAIGNLEHAMMETIFRNEDLTNSEISRDQFKKNIREFCDSFTNWWCRTQPRPLSLVLEARLEELSSAILLTVLDILDREPVETPELFEKWESSRRIDASHGELKGVNFFGRVDMVTRRCSPTSKEDEYILVDFKKNTLPQKKQVLSGGDVQMPLYVSLLEDSGYSVGGARYRSIEGRETKVVFDDVAKGWMMKKDFNDLKNTVIQKSMDIAKSADAGIFTVIDEAGGCDGCRFRPVCRIKYGVR